MKKMYDTKKISLHGAPNRLVSVSNAAQCLLLLGLVLTTFTTALPVFAQHDHSAHGHGADPAPKKTPAPSPPADQHDHSSHAGHNAKLDGAISQEKLHVEIPAVRLLNRQGAEASLQELIDTNKLVVLNFIFTTCNAICPVMSSAFSGFTKIVGEDLESYRLISISIDPEYDTPEQLSEYAERHAARGDWHFLTGQLEDIRATQRAFDAYRGSKMNHEPATYLFNREHEGWTRLNGLATPTQILDEATKLRGQSDL